MARGRSLFGPAVMAGVCGVAACGHDWDSFDPRLGVAPDASGGSSATTTTTSEGPSSSSVGPSSGSSTSSSQTGAGGSAGSGGAGGSGGCGDTLTDQKNCGACGHDCLGGDCTSGICQPKTLATGGAFIGLVLTDTEIYWADKTAGVITVASKDGSNPSPYAQQASVEYLATDGMNLFWTTGTTIRKRPLAGGPITDLVTATNLEGLSVLGNQIYLTEWDQGFFEVPKSGGIPTPITVGSVLFAEGVANWNNIVYWCDNAGTITAYDLAINSSMPFVTGEASPAGICIYDGVVYWTNQGTGELRARAVTGDVTQTLVTGLNIPTGVAVDDTAIYWAEATGGVVRRLAR